MTNPTVEVPPMCNTHRVLLVKQAHYGPSDPWQVMELVVQIALFQAMSANPKVHTELKMDLTNLSKLGCMACRKPDVFGQLVEAAKTHKLSVIKELGEKFVSEGARPTPTS